VQPLHGFTQRPCRQQPAIAELALRIDNNQFNVAPHAVMLQTIGANEDIALRMYGEQGAAGSHPVGAHPDRASTAAKKKQRLVTHYSSGTVGIYGTHALQFAAISAADDAGPEARLFELLRQPYHQWRLAGTTDADVADHNQRHRARIAFQQAACIRLATTGRR